MNGKQIKGGETLRLVLIVVELAEEGRNGGKVLTIWDDFSFEFHTSVCTELAFEVAPKHFLALGAIPDAHPCKKEIFIGKNVGLVELTDQIGVDAASGQNNDHQDPEGDARVFGHLQQKNASISSSLCVYVQTRVK